MAVDHTAAPSRSLKCARPLLRVFTSRPILPLPPSFRHPFTPYSPGGMALTARTSYSYYPTVTETVTKKKNLCSAKVTKTATDGE